MSCVGQVACIQCIRVHIQYSYIYSYMFTASELNTVSSTYRLSRERSWNASLRTLNVVFFSILLFSYDCLLLWCSCLSYPYRPIPSYPAMSTSTMLNDHSFVPLLPNTISISYSYTRTYHWFTSVPFTCAPREHHNASTLQRGSGSSVRVGSSISSS